MDRTVVDVTMHINTHMPLQEQWHSHPSDRQLMPLGVHGVAS